MHPHFEKGTGFLIIEWYEKRENGSPIHHYYSQIPTYLQLHPRDPKKIVRATFADKIPSWMEKYAKEHDFRVQQVTRSGEVGWWIANWRIYPDGHKPLTSPHLDGAFEQFTRKIPDVCEDIKSTVLENKETIKMNLRNYPDAYEVFGLYFRAEEIKGEGGALVIEDFIPSQETDESDEDYRLSIERDGRLEKLVFELITPLPEPVRDEEEEPVEEILDEEEVTFDLEFSDDEEELSLEGIAFEDTDEEEVSLEGFELEDEDPSENEEPVTEESEVISDFDVEDEEAAEPVAETHTESETTEQESSEVPDEEEEEVESDVPEAEVEADESTEDTKEELIEQPLFNEELKVADTTDKKVVEGQFSLF